ncbi:MAG: TonB-dependent receptor [Dysgonamonadaceae bacterium]|jgi:TonB-linked SusC/RagA family outer membrane protein|nr:TonB-dependent receptor [Dysgonamonadaceae bacterium]
MKKISKQKLPSVFQTRVFVVCCLFFLGGLDLFAQKMSISGTVTDETGDALIGVSVQISQTKRGVATDMNGKYAIDADKGDVLEFYYLGMATQKVVVGTNNVIDIRMKEEETVLGEAVVIGYGTAKKRDLTGSIVSIKASDISDRPSSNPLASIQGKVAGVQVINTGRAGQDPEIRIRGTNSINGFAPLYVVDGLFADNINYLNPADVESMEILKDPSSLAIFGVRGANGVIIITTKKAKEGQTLVNFNTSVGWKQIYDRVDVTNAAQFKELYNEQLQNQKRDPFDYTYWSADTDWQDEIFRTGFMTNNNLSIIGSTGKNKFYMGVGYTSEEGSIKSEEFEKVTLSLGSDYSVSNAVRFGFKFNGSRTLPPDAKGVGGAVKAAPIAPIRDDASGLLSIMPSFQSAQLWNPMIAIEIDGKHNIGINYRGAGSVYGEVDFLKHFNFKLTLSADFSSGESRQYIPVLAVYDPSIPGAGNLRTTQSVNQSKSTRLNTQADYVLTYDNKFGDHGLTATAGFTTNYLSYSSISAGRSQNLNDIIFSIPNDNSDKWWITALDQNAMTNGGSQYNRFLMSYLLRGLYNYKSRYLLNVSYRRDGSSVFYGVGNTWDHFYSAGAGWVVSEEDFMQNQSTIDFLKLKGSWGILGSQNTGGRNYPSYPELTSSGSAVFGDKIITGYSYQYLVQNLGWEKTNSWEAGFEMNLLNQRLRIEPVYYNKTTHDLIVSLPSRTGAQNSLENMGKIRNRGLELSGSWSDRISDSEFKYTLGGNLTTIDNEVLSLGRDAADAIYSGTKSVARSLAGYPVGYFYGYKVTGVYQNNQDIRTSPVNTLASIAPGDLKFADISGPDGVPDGKITDADRTMIGNPTPDFTYGFNINLAYKNFDLGIDMMGVYGNEIFRTWDDPTYAQFNYLTKRINRWNGEGTSNWEPVLDPFRSINQMNSSYFIEDGSFFRIRNIQLGYSFSPQLLNKVYVKSLRLYANVQNLKTWSKNIGYTPEIGGSAIAFGIDDGTYPMPAIYTVGLNLTF